MDPKSISIMAGYRLRFSKRLEAYDDALQPSCAEGNTRLRHS